MSITLKQFADGTQRAFSNGVELIVGLPMEEYHKTSKQDDVQYYSKTRLHAIVQVDKGPEWVAKMWRLHPGSQAEDTGDRDVGDGKEAHYKVGRAIDDLLFFGPEKYKRYYTLCPETYPSEVKKTALNLEGIELKPWTNKAAFCQKWKADKEESGVTVLTNAQAEWIERAYESAHRHEGFHEVLTSPDWQSQLTFRWKDAESGMFLQCRPDMVNLNTIEWLDLKTTRYWMYEAYGRQYFNLAYHLQSYLIDEGIRLFTGVTPWRRRHAIIGKMQWPQVRIDPLHEAHIQPGGDLLRRCIAEYKRCERTGQWYTPQEEERYVSIPGFVQQAIVNHEATSSREFYELERYQDLEG
jgi:hypothetical protein